MSFVFHHWFSAVSTPVYFSALAPTPNKSFIANETFYNTVKTGAEEKTIQKKKTNVNNQKRFKGTKK